MAHANAREGKWRGNWRIEWVASTLHTTSEHGVSSITTVGAHTSAASSRLNWSPSRFQWTRPFCRKTKSGFCACAVTFQTQYATVLSALRGKLLPHINIWWGCLVSYLLYSASCISQMLRTFFAVATGMCRKSARSGIDELQSSWNVMAHGDALEEKWRGNWGMEWVSSTLHTTSGLGVSSITTADARAHLGCQ